MSKQLATEINDTEVTVLVDQANNDVVIIEFDLGDGTACRLVTSPEQLRSMGVRLYGCARKILGDTQRHRERSN